MNSIEQFQIVTTVNLKLMFVPQVGDRESR